MSPRPPRKAAAPKPDAGRASAAMGLAGQIDQHAQARRAAPKGSAEWHHHNEQMKMKMAHLQKVDSTLHASVVSIVALQDRLHQSEQITMSQDVDTRRERRADPRRREAIARDRATLREAKDLFQKRSSAGVARSEPPAAEPSTEPSSRPRRQPPRGEHTVTYEEWKERNG